MLAVFNTVLGEELLFRGLLLPRMNGVFGDATGSRTACCSPPTTCTCRGPSRATLLDTFIVAYPSKRYRSALVGIAVHSAQTVSCSSRLSLSLVLS